MSKPTIKAGPAAQYEGHNEIIREIHNGQIGGLISLRTLDDGTLRVDLYRLDAGVEVVTGQGPLFNHESATPTPKRTDEETYRAEVIAIIDSFTYELCSNCGEDLSKHRIGPDPLGHAHLFCLTEES